MDHRTLLVAMIILGFSVPTASGQDGWIVFRDKTGSLKVETIVSNSTAPAKALAVWNDGARERWQVVPAGWHIPTGNEEPPPQPVAIAVRGVAVSGLGLHEFAQLTLQLDQLRGAVVARDLDSSFLTPAREGVCLSGRITIRRMPHMEKMPFPADVADLAQLGTARKSWKLAFAEGQSKREWKELTELAKDFPAGLRPGTYSLVMAGKKTIFQVESADVALKVLQPIREAETLLTKQKDPLLVSLMYDHLVGQLDANAVPKYLPDALDLLDRQSELPSYLKKQREILLSWLRTPPEERVRAVRSAQANQEQPLGIEELDIARGLLERGNRAAAEKLLKHLTGTKAPQRTVGLAELYLGVLHAEGGYATSEKAEQHFTRATELLESAAPSDRLRLHNNRADYFHQQAQDHLYNHALRMAAGIERPMASFLSCWRTALEGYEIAFELAKENNIPGPQSALAINMARHYALLADFVRTLDAAKASPDLAAVADAQAQRWANTSLKTSQSSPLLQGMAKELAAQLAFRQGAHIEAARRASEAQTHYLEVGFLAGVENLQRLQGLTASTPTEALRHYRLSALISESLRQRMPADRIGTTQAGFFARKAWVFDKMVELLLKDGKADEALRVVELSRARTLQDYLPADPEITRAADQSVADLTTVLAQWPADTVALEYFLAGEQAYVFFVNTRGCVQAFPLLDPQGKPLASKTLISEVQRFLRETEGHSGKMARRIMAQKGFDHTWQDDLHGLYQSLVPTSLQKEIAAAKTTVIVPQHLLHYFPFAALVTQRDKAKRASKQMVSPRFWIDEPGQRLVTPSLTLWHTLRNRPLTPIRQVTAIGLVEAPGAERLEGVETDLNNLKAVFGNQVRQVIVGNQATVSAVKQALEQPGLLFFGTHGYNDGERPLHSFLLMMPAADRKTPDEQTGRLTAQTVFQIPVAADLVVMSACYSGLGDRSPMPGDDLFGLQRAFLQSGSRAVLAGLWDVYDGTAPDLMNGFFVRFAQGEPVAQALQGSQRDFLQKLRTSGRTEPYLHPYFWSVYTLIGDDRVRFEKK